MADSRRNKNTNKPVILQILDLVPRWLFDNCTNTYKTDKGCSKYKTYDLKKHHQSFVIEEIKGKSKLIDSSTIPLCLARFDWAKFRTAKGRVKIHTCLDVELMLPDVFNISEAKVHDRNGLEQLVFPQNTIIVEDRGYLDFTLMMNRIAAKNTFVTSIKCNTVYDTVEEIDLPGGNLLEELLQKTTCIFKFH